MCGSLSFCLAGYVSFIVCAKQNHATPPVAGGASLGFTLIYWRLYLSVRFLCGEWNYGGAMRCSFLGFFVLLFLSVRFVLVVTSLFFSFSFVLVCFLSCLSSAHM